jgi:hypothetical protein
VVLRDHHRLSFVDVTTAVAKRTLRSRKALLVNPILVHGFGCWQRCHTTMSLSVSVEQSMIQDFGRAGRGGIKLDVFDHDRRVGRATV